ncbi:MAG: phosphoribosyltransferase family protein [Patescibacteria group bacterium]
MFQDRQQAGEELAKALVAYRGQPGVVVIALPRGGVVVGNVVARALSAPLDIVVPRKIGFPGHEEYAIGAITETGEAVWNEAERARVSDEYVKEAMTHEQAEAKRRLNVYRSGRQARDVEGTIVILVDDGIATGYTMRAAIKTLRTEAPQKIVVAVPLAPPETVEQLRAEVDEVIALQQPRFFGAIGVHYQEFGQVDDETVIQALLS